MHERLRARPVTGHGDVEAFFDACAPDYADRHGKPGRLLRYRLSLLRAGAGLRPGDALLEIGCGDGLHLIALAGELERGIGVDLSPAMIEAARLRLRGCPGPWRERVSFQVDAAERLATVADESVDVAIFVGALEHVLDQGAALRSAFRVLRPGGRLVCLTLNGGSLWYRRLAPALGLEMRRLSTDRYLSRRELARLLHAAGFGGFELGHWTFVQRGDMPPLFAALLQGLDGIGRLLGIGALRGGLRTRAVKPRSRREWS